MVEGFLGRAGRIYFLWSQTEFLRTDLQEPPPPPHHILYVEMYTFIFGDRANIAVTGRRLKVHKIENFFDSDFGICVISLLVMHK